MASLSHKDRLRACLTDDPALDHPPVALWRHFPVDDQSPQGLAAAVLDFQRHYDFDLVKVTPASSFCLKDWGVEDIWEGHPEGTRRYFKHVIEKPQDWEHLPLLDPNTASHLSAQLACLRSIRAGLGPETPLLQTVFSPLAQAKNLAGGDLLLVHLRRYPEALLQGLETIAETTRRFMEACLETGIDGVFYAVQHAQPSLLSLVEFKTFGLALDLQVLRSASGLWCNLLHLHGLDVYFDLVAEYISIVQSPLIVNWHDRETPPSLAGARASLVTTVPPVFCGGISQHTIVHEDPSQVMQEAADAIAQVGGRRLLLGTGCVVPIIAPHGNLLAAKKAVIGKES